MTGRNTARADCPVCGRPTATLKDGRIGRHGAKPDGTYVWPPRTCPGWGQDPKENPDASGVV